METVDIVWCDLKETETPIITNSLADGVELCEFCMHVFLSVANKA